MKQSFFMQSDATIDLIIDRLGSNNHYESILIIGSTSKQLLIKLSKKIIYKKITHQNQFISNIDQLYQLIISAEPLDDNQSYIFIKNAFSILQAGGMALYINLNNTSLTKHINLLYSEGFYQIYTELISIIDWEKNQLLIGIKRKGVVF